VLEPAQRRAEHRGHAEDRAHRTLVLAPSRNGITSAMSAIAVTIKPPPAALDRPRGDQEEHLFAESGQHRTAHEHDRADLEDRLAPEYVAELADHDGRDRLREQYDVTTHAMCPASPRSATTVGSAVETIVWSSAAMSMPSMIATKTRLRRGLPKTGGVGASTSGRGAVSTVLIVRNESRKSGTRWSRARDPDPAGVGCGLAFGPASEVAWNWWRSCSPSPSADSS
jgi:hypothetical protein